MVRRMLAYCTAQASSLYPPPSVITTGTPPGVGLGQKPPVYLKVGDRVGLGIEGLGEQHQLCVVDE